MPLTHLESIHSEEQRALAQTVNTPTVISLQSSAVRLLNFVSSLTSAAGFHFGVS
jgi:hypothetical protein